MGIFCFMSQLEESERLCKTLNGYGKQGLKSRPFGRCLPGRFYLSQENKQNYMERTLKCCRVELFNVFT